MPTQKRQPEKRPRQLQTHQSHQTHVWQRVLLATFATALLGIGALIATTNMLGIGSREFVSGTLLKVGFVLGLVWLAAPQLERFGWQKLRGTLLIATILVLALWTIRPKIGAVAGVILVGGSLAFAIAGWVRNLSKPPRR